MRRILCSAATLFLLACVAGPAASAQSAAKSKAMTARGSVKSVGDATLVLDAAGKDMTFTLDNATRVVAKGAGTKAKSMGGKGQVTSFVHAGDTVAVTYHQEGSTMLATKVTVSSPRRK
jgi:hypothetical protein